MSYDALKNENALLVKHLKAAVRGRALAERRLAKAVEIVAKKQRPEIRRAILGFPYVNVGAGAANTLTMDPQKVLAELAMGETVMGTVEVNTQPSVPVTPERLIVTSKGFRIEDLRIGRNSMMLNASGISGDVFAGDVNRIEDNDAPPFILDTCDVGMLISICVTNMTDKAQPFDAALVCMLPEFEFEAIDEKEVDETIAALLR